MAIQERALEPEPGPLPRGVVVPFRGRRVRQRLLRAISNLAFLFLAGLCIAVGAVSVGSRVLPYRVLPVLTGSMERAIATGSLAIAVAVSADQLQVGDVITFSHPLQPRTYVTHRIVGIEDEGASRRFVTQGDANAQPDPWRVLAKGEGYRYVTSIPSLGASLVAFEASPLHVALFAIPMVVLAALALAWIWRPSRAPLRIPSAVRALAARAHQP